MVFWALKSKKVKKVYKTKNLNNFALVTIDKIHIPGRPLIRGHFFQNSLASTMYSQIAQFSDMLRKIG